MTDGRWNKPQRLSTPMKPVLPVGVSLSGGAIGDVHQRIVNLDDLPADRDGIRQPDRIGSGQQLGDGLGDRGLAVARRPVQEQR